MKILDVLPLTAQWVIVVVSTLDDVVRAIDDLSGGEYLPLVARWEESKGLAKRDWHARKLMVAMRDKHIATARVLCNEHWLAEVDLYEPLPVEVGHCIVGLGEGTTPGGPDVEYVHYCYLKLALPMEPGGYCVLTVGESEYKYQHGLKPSRAIKVNQLGYLPDAPRKVAYFGAHIYGVGALEPPAEMFEVIPVGETEPVYVGPLVYRDVTDVSRTEQMITGEQVYEMDFTRLLLEGNFYISIPGVGTSWPFRHAADVYGQAMFTTMRGFYHQRCGLPIRAPQSAWPRAACHHDPVYESEHVQFPHSFVDRPKEYDRFDVIGATLERNTDAEPTLGGWHDAADWDRNNAHYTVIFDLLYAYEMAPEKFTDGQFLIRESGNGIPDILDEVAWGLRVWAQSMDDDGGVSGMIECNTHPSIDADVDYAFSRRTRWDSLLFAAAAAMLSEHLKPFSARDAGRWNWYAQRAYRWGANPENSLGKVTINARRQRGAGEAYTLEWQETEAHVAPYLFHAKVRMYRMTGATSYLEGVDGLGKFVHAPYRWPWNNRDYSPWMVYSCLPLLPAANRREVIEKSFLAYADTRLAHLESMAYRCTWPAEQDFWMMWGAADMCNDGRALFIAYQLTGEEKYRDAAILNFDFMLGCNPMGMSWTTGLGKVYPVDIQHAVSHDDGIDDPVPGITVYGPSGGMYGLLRSQVWSSPGPEGPVEFFREPVPVWRTFSPHPTHNTAQCEFTIQETMSCMAFCAAMLAPEGWMPERIPEPRAPIRYYLP